MTRKKDKCVSQFKTSQHSYLIPTIKKAIKTLSICHETENCVYRLTGNKNS